MNIENLIIQFVASKNACKFQELYNEFIQFLSYDELIAITFKLIQNNELIEVKYSHSKVHGDRVGILSPKGTEISITKQIFN